MGPPESHVFSASPEVFLGPRGLGPGALAFTLPVGHHGRDRSSRCAEPSGRTLRAPASAASSLARRSPGRAAVGPCVAPGRSFCAPAPSWDRLSQAVLLSRNRGPHVWSINKATALGRTAQGDVRLPGPAAPVNSRLPARARDAVSTQPALPGTWAPEMLSARRRLPARARDAVRTQAALPGTWALLAVQPRRRSTASA